MSEKEAFEEWHFKNISNPPTLNDLIAKAWNDACEYKQKEIEKIQAENAELEEQLKEIDRSKSRTIELLNEKCNKLLLAGSREADKRVITEKKLEITVEALRFYGNIENWRNTKYPKKADFNTLDSEEGRDIDTIRGGHNIAGKRARQVLKELGAK